MIERRRPPNRRTPNKRVLATREGVSPLDMFAAERNETDWKSNIIRDVDAVRHVVLATKRVAVLGIRSEKDSSRPAFYVPQYLLSAGLEVIPVLVHDLKVHTILGQPVFRRLRDIPGELDLVDVFRRPEDLPAHLEDFLAKRPTAVWFQSGIRNDEVAESLAQAGIKVVQDRCLMVDHRRYAVRLGITRP